jgi:hypothetical protein
MRILQTSNRKLHLLPGGTEQLLDWRVLNTARSSFR